MNTHRIGAVAVAVVVAACGSSSSSLSEAFCADLDDGLSMMNLWPRDMDPADFAEDAWGYVATTCPEHYGPNRAYFDSWDLPPIDG